MLENYIYKRQFFNKMKSKKNKNSQNGSNSQEWKTADLRNWVKQDIKAAIALLDLIHSNEELFNLVCVAIEGWRANMIKKENAVPDPEKVAAQPVME